MRQHGTQGRRSRNRPHSHTHNNGVRRPQNRNQIFDSNGPDVRIRGTAHQVCEKYLALAKDAASSGDSILAESYLQHAEHYQRIINTWNDESRETPYLRNNTTPQPYSEQGGDVAIEDDLSLPVSILGGDIKSVSQDRGGHSSVPNLQESEPVLERAS